MSCSRQSSAIDFGPRNDASTISVFCWAVNFRYLRVSLIDPLDRLSGRFSEGLRTEPRRLRRLAPTQNHLRELSTASRGPGQMRTSGLSPRNRSNLGSSLPEMRHRQANQPAPAELL